jgi:hypothetical protein
VIEGKKRKRNPPRHKPHNDGNWIIKTQVSCSKVEGLACVDVGCPQGELPLSYAIVQISENGIPIQRVVSEGLLGGDKNGLVACDEDAGEKAT